MARDRFERIVRGEVGAFEKLTGALHHAREAADGLSRRLTTADLSRLTEALRHCIEATTEISTWRSDPRWFALTPQFEQLLDRVNGLQLRATATGGSAVPPRYWTAMAGVFDRIRGAALSLWQDSENNAVQGSRLQ